MAKLFFTFGPKEIGSVLATYPEMVLGADLPSHCIKWTKNIRLLSRGNTREKLRTKADGKNRKIDR